MAGKHPSDLENGFEDKPHADVDVTDTDGHQGSADYELSRVRAIQDGFTPLRVLREAEEWLDAKLGVESQGIDRIPENEKRPPSIINSFWIWWSMSLHVGTMPIGVLGPEFGLSLNQSAAAIVVGTFLGSLCTAFTATLGPKLGLRQIACSRYSFGFWGAKLPSVLNVLAGGGFLAVNIVVCGQILSAVSDYKMTISVGCIIVSVIGYLISVFGFAIIHTYEKYSWLPPLILLAVLLAQASPHISSSAPATKTGLPLTGAFLSFLAINFSSASSWCSLAADYYCNYPATTSPRTVFLLTLFGLTLPTVFATLTGACIANAALSTPYPPYATAYDAHGLGGLIATIYHPTPWSKFALVLLTFSVLGNNIATNYSCGLSLQLLGHHFHAVPRSLWSLCVALVAAVLAIAGKNHLSTVVSNFVSLLGYWAVSFTLILLLEDRWFRRRDAYVLTAWNRPEQLPWGVAAVTALLIGYLAGGVTGMAQTWYVGPVAARFGAEGGDVGIYLSAVLTGVAYPVLRSVEKRVTGR